MPGPEVRTALPVLGWKSYTQGDIQCHLGRWVSFATSGSLCPESLADEEAQIYPEHGMKEDI